MLLAARFSLLTSHFSLLTSHFSLLTSHAIIIAFFVFLNTAKNLILLPFVNISRIKSHDFGDKS